MQSSTTQIELDFLFSAKDASRIKFMKMSKVKSADSVVHQFLRVLSKPSQAPKCHWSNCDCPKNPKAANCAPSADGNVTRHQTLHHPMLYIKQFFIKSIYTQKANDTNQGKWRPREGRAKKKKIKTKKKKSDCRLKRRGNDWLLGLMFLSRHIVPAVQSQFISQTYW